MRFTDLLSMAFYNLWRRKLRTSLTVLAVVIGATLVALMVSIGSGLQSFIVGQFGEIVPQDAVIVSSIKDVFQRQDNSPHEITSTNLTASNPFTYDDLQKIKAIPGVVQVDYNVSVSARYIQPQDSSKMYSVSVNAAPVYQAELRKLVAGTDIIADDVTGQCVLAYDYLKAFGWSDAESALGKQVSITVGKLNPYNTATQAYQFTVVGVLDKTMNVSDVFISLPDGKEMARFYQDNPLLYSEQQPGYALYLRAESISQVDSIAQAVKDLNFSAITPAELLAQINSVFSVIQIGLSAFGVIALIVAAIGIINTLLMAIHERTREIGIMKAVGATRGTIRIVFTVEGGALGFLGGIIGTLLALGLGQLLNFIGSRTFLSDFPGFKMSVFPVWLVFGVTALTTFISLVAGLYPANNAAKLDPVDALRYE